MANKHEIKAKAVTLLAVIPKDKRKLAILESLMVRQVLLRSTNFNIFLSTHSVREFWL